MKVLYRRFKLRKEGSTINVHSHCPNVEVICHRMRTWTLCCQSASALTEFDMERCSSSQAPGTWELLTLTSSSTAPVPCGLGVTQTGQQSSICRGTTFINKFRRPRMLTTHGGYSEAHSCPLSHVIKLAYCEVMR